MLVAMPVAAEKADRDKPMNAEADALRYDDLKQTSVFTGNVVITKGTTIIRGSGLMCGRTPKATSRPPWSLRLASWLFTVKSVIWSMSLLKGRPS